MDLSQFDARQPARRLIIGLCLLFVALFSAPFAGGAQQTDGSLVAGWPTVGKIRPRAASEARSTFWSVGAETLDRDFATYANYRQFLGPLGAKGLRLQTGWAKCERERGVYDWKWLDEIVDDAVHQGLRPWLETSYGNPIYPGGGGTSLGGGFPKSAEALAAWDRWVRALVRRYRDRVNEWEIWNEPDLTPSNAPSDYASLFIRTAEIVRQEQPGARIYALALAGRLEFAEAFLRHVHEAGKTSLIDAVTIHGYPRNPDDTGNIDQMRKLLARFAPGATVRQGETGAPSKRQAAFALANLDWSENTQAKWDLRRMLAHRAKDVPFNLFTIVDMQYQHNGKLEMNWKGLLAANPDRTVAAAKPSYFAAQRVLAIWDDALQRAPETRVTTSLTERVAATAYRKQERGSTLVAVWLSGAPPIESNAKKPVDVSVEGGTFSEPVYVDLLDGTVARIPRDRWSSQAGQTIFRQIPVYDAPVVIADKPLLPIGEP